MIVLLLKITLLTLIFILITIWETFLLFIIPISFPILFLLILFLRKAAFNTLLNPTTLIY